MSILELISVILKSVFLIQNVSIEDEYILKMFVLKM